MPAFCSLEHASDNANFHVDCCRAYPIVATPFPKPKDILARNLREAFLLKKLAWLGQELALLFLAGFAQLQLAPTEILLGGLKKG
jgi:hypothetical protein